MTVWVSEQSENEICMSIIFLNQILDKLSGALDGGEGSAEKEAQNKVGGGAKAKVKPVKLKVFFNEEETVID